eukprot:TRINITY_DN16363_c0_g1_i5.p1 TRINITY_DN16363_c0_g1~~TRINITY_DN16363_c0_g1_i5.p1  ORF type:complete len:743 (-),score=70.04 TRINITY_DN16363_c0_g1_i5:1295-3523(-)
MSVTQNPMLGIHVKKTEKVSLVKPLYDYSVKVYGAQAAEKVKEDLHMLQDIRNQIAAQEGTQQSLKQVLLRYYQALLQLELRVQVGRNRGQATLSFVWYDAFRTSKRASQGNLYFEKAGVLFNLAAIHSQIALNTSRSDGEGIKEACKYFQEAAGHLTLVKELVEKYLDYKQCTMDFSIFCISMLEQIMLAQAQECFYEKAYMDNKSAAVMSMIAKQIFLLYTEVQNNYSKISLQGYLDSTWGYHINCKVHLWNTESLRQFAMQFDDTVDIGKKIAALRECQAILLKAQKIGKLGGSELEAQVNYAVEQVYSSLKQAELDNNTIYFQKISDFSDLPPIKPAILAKAKVPNFSPESSETWFEDLIPVPCQQALEEYTKRGNAVKQSVLGAAETRENAMKAKLEDADLMIVYNIYALDSQDHLPSSVQQQLEQYKGKNMLEELKTSMVNIFELRNDCLTILSTCSTDVSSVHKDMAKNFQQQIQHTQLSLNTAKEISDFLEKSVDENKSTVEKFQDYKITQNLPQLEMSVPAIKQMIFYLQSLSENIKKINLIKNEIDKDAFEAKIKKEKNNLLKEMLNTSEPYDALIQGSLQPYEDQQKNINKTCESIDNLISTIISDVGSFNEDQNVKNWRAAQKSFAQEITEELKFVEQIQDNLGKLEQFYIQLQDILGRVHEAMQVVIKEGKKVKKQSAQLVSVLNVETEVVEVKIRGMHTSIVPSSETNSLSKLQSGQASFFQRMFGQI